MTMHKSLFEGRWAQMPFNEQMANIGSEVSRTISWIKKNNMNQATRAFERGLELFDCSLSVKQRYPALKELCRARENFCELFLELDLKGLEGLNKYFYHFANYGKN